MDMEKPISSVIDTYEAETGAQCSIIYSGGCTSPFLSRFQGGFRAQQGYMPIYILPNPDLNHNKL